MNEVLHLLGLDNASGGQYLFWSGFFSDITIFTAIIYHFTHTRCHVAGCLRKGKHDFRHYKLCKKHHPSVPEKVTHLHIAKLHKAGK